MTIATKTAAATAAALFLVPLVPGAGAAPAHRPPVPSAARGQVVSTRQVQHLDARAVRTALHQDGFDMSGVRFGVDAYRLVYRTVDVRHRTTTASGLVVVPRTAQRRLGTVSYAHGTMAGRDEAPSVDTDGRSDEGLTFASAGYAAVEPDYLGLGVGPGRHPYL